MVSFRFVDYYKPTASSEKRERLLVVYVSRVCFESKNSKDVLFRPIMMSQLDNSGKQSN